MLNNIPNGKARGFDGLNAFVIKQAKYVLAKPLACIFNKSLITGIFPDSLKIGKVTQYIRGGGATNIILAIIDLLQYYLHFLKFLRN